MGLTYLQVLCEVEGDEVSEVQGVRRGSSTCVQVELLPGLVKIQDLKKKRANGHRRESQRTVWGGGGVHHTERGSKIRHQDGLNRAII